MAVIKRSRKLNVIQLKNGTDLAGLFKQIKAVENQFSDLPKNLSEDDKIAIVLERRQKNMV